jgi:hypothetical protein
MPVTTVESIVTEALKSSGIRTPEYTQIDRATNEWYPEVLNDIRSRKQWVEGVNVLKDWRYVLTLGVLLKALKDKFDNSEDSLAKIRETERDYENQIRILFRKDNREAFERQFTNKQGGMPTTRGST